MAKAAPATLETDIRRPRIVTALGKQGLGKTMLLRWIIERGAKSRNRPLKIIDADPHNQTLERYFDGVLTPGSTAIEDRRVFIETAILEQKRAAQSGDIHDLVIDIGGGDLMMQRLSHEVRFTQTLEQSGVDLICFFLLGPNPKDLSYFDGLVSAGFRPKNIALVFNAGLVPGDRSPDRAFGPLLDEKLVMDLVAHGAVPLYMPSLASDCVAAIDDSGARTFREALTKLDMWHEMRLETWLDQAMEKQIAQRLADMGWLV